MPPPLRTLRTWPAALAAVAGSVLVGFLPIMAYRLYREGVSTPALLFWRYSLALPVLAAIAVMAGCDLRHAWKRGAWQIALVGMTLGSAQTLCYFESLKTLESSIAVLLFYTYPAITLGIERVFFKRPIRPIAVACIAVTFAGAALIAGPGVETGRINPHGLLWAVPGPLVYAFYLAANAALMRRHPPIVSAGFLYLGFAATYLIAVLATGCAVPATAGGWLALLFIAFGAGALSITLFSYSVPRLGPSSYAIIANVELVTVVIIGILVLGDALTAARAAGGGLIIAGIVLHGLSRRKPPRPEGRDGAARLQWDRAGPLGSLDRAG